MGAMDTSQEVFDAYSGQIFATNENSFESNTMTFQAKCIPKKDCYQFTIHDSHGDGGAEWILEYDGDSVASDDGNFEYSDSTTFGANC